MVATVTMMGGIPQCVPYKHNVGVLVGVQVVVCHEAQSRLMFEWRTRNVAFKDL